jgi:hypothetical protein
MTFGVRHEFSPKLKKEINYTKIKISEAGHRAIAAPAFSAQDPQREIGQSQKKTQAKKVVVEFSSFVLIRSNSPPEMIYSVELFCDQTYTLDFVPLFKGK